MKKCLQACSEGTSNNGKATTSLSRLKKRCDVTNDQRAAQARATAAAAEASFAPVFRQSTAGLMRSSLTRSLYCASSKRGTQQTFTDHAS